MQLIEDDDAEVSIDQEMMGSHWGLFRCKRCGFEVGDVVESGVDDQLEQAFPYQGTWPRDGGLEELRPVRLQRVERG